MKQHTRIAPGIYQDAYGYRVMAAVGSGARLLKSPEIRYPPGTPLEVLKARWHREKTRLSDEYQKHGGRRLRGTLAADIPEYFRTVTLSPQRRQERDAIFTWWIARFGDVPRGALDPVKLRQALNSLRHPVTKAPAAASTKNKYRGALSHLFTVLDGKAAVNPMRDVPQDKEPPAERRDQSYEFIQVLLAKMQDRGPDRQLSRAKAYFLVRAYCPVTQAQLAFVKPSDVHWDTSELSTPGRHKGQGTRGRRKPLSALGLAAFRHYDEADCWGRTPSRSSLRKFFIRARDAAVAELRESRPEVDWSNAAQMLPKDLRHSFATLTYQQTGSLSVTQELLDHAERSTTLRYAQGALPAHLKAAGAAIDAAFKALPPYTPPGKRGLSPDESSQTELPNTDPKSRGIIRKKAELPNTAPRLVKRRKSDESTQIH
jgi:integrase